MSTWKRKDKRNKERGHRNNFMKAGEKNILIGIVVFMAVVMAYRTFVISRDGGDKGIPFYSTASKELQNEALLLMKKLKCRDCHTLWTQRNIMKTVPSPPLDGIGSLRDEDWFFNYFSAKDPQAILPSRLKPEFRMPSYVALQEDQRRLLAKYMGSLKVEDWYLEDTKKKEYEKLTGKKYTP